MTDDGARPMPPQSKPAPPPAPAGRRVRRRRVGLFAAMALVVCVFTIDFAMMPRTFLPGDPFAWREETMAILRDRRLSIDPAIAAQMNGQSPGAYFDRNVANGRYYSKYGVMNALMSAPPFLMEMLYFGRVANSADAGIVIFNLYYIVLSVMVALALWALTGRYSPRPWMRFALVFIAMYATYLWYYQRAQGAEIYQTLFFTCFFYSTVRAVQAVRDRGHVTRTDRRWLLIGWLFLAALVYTREVFAVLLAAPELALAWAIWSAPGSNRFKIALRELPLLLLPPAAIVLGLAWINRVKFGSIWLTGYHQWRPEIHMPTGPMAQGLGGILFSWQWSIFLYFPILGLGLLAARPFWKRFRADAVLMLTSFVPYLLLLSKIPSWRGEEGYGPRYFLFALPVLSMPFILVLEWFWQSRQRLWAWIPAVIVLAALGYSAYLQFQVNCEDFFVAYRARAPLESILTRDMQSVFWDHNTGTIVADLVRCQSRPDDLPFFPLLTQVESSNRIALYRRYLYTLIGQTNLYWWPPEPPPPGWDSIANQPAP